VTQENQAIEKLAALSTGMVAIVLNKVLVYSHNQALLTHRAVDHSGVLDPGDA
jgi:hypothetical protein